MEEVEDIVKLQSNDDRIFEVPEKVAVTNETVKNLLEDCDRDLPIPLPNVDGSTLEKVIEFETHYVENPLPVSDDEKNTRRELTEWDIEFCNQCGQQMLFQLILAGNYLDNEHLLDVTCKAVANLIKGKTTEEIRTTFNIKNDFTPEEELQIQKENEWCEERG